MNILLFIVDDTNWDTPGAFGGRYGDCRFRNESMSGRTFSAMEQAAESDQEIEKRVNHFLYRVPQEMYDFRSDPDALQNRVDDPEEQERLQAFRERLKQWMEATQDELVRSFQP